MFPTRDKKPKVRHKKKNFQYHNLQLQAQKTVKFQNTVT